MNRDDVIRLMVAMSPPDFADATVDEEGLNHFMPLFEAIAAEAAAKEREACAKVCEIVWDSRAGLETGTAFECAAAIRARGTK